MKRADRRKHHFIYKTTCLITGRYYYGMHSTDDLEDNYLGSGKILGYSIKKYGKESHIREVFETLPDRKSLVLREAEIVDKGKLNDPLCINLILGSGGDNNVSKGFRSMKHCEAISTALRGKRRPNISKSLKGKKLSDSHKEAISKGGIGKKKSTITKEKIVKARIGKQQTEATKLLISNSLKGRRGPKHNLGAHWCHNPETGDTMLFKEIIPSGFQRGRGGMDTRRGLQSGT